MFLATKNKQNRPCSVDLKLKGTAVSSVCARLYLVVVLGVVLKFNSYQTEIENYYYFVKAFMCCPRPAQNLPRQHPLPWFLPGMFTVLSVQCSSGIWAPQQGCWLLSGKNSIRLDLTFQDKYCMFLIFDVTATVKCIYIIFICVHMTPLSCLCMYAVIIHPPKCICSVNTLPKPVPPLFSWSGHFLTSHIYLYIFPPFFF